MVGEPVATKKAFDAFLALQASMSSWCHNLLCLKPNESLPIFIGTPCGTSILLPKCVSAFTQMFVKSAMPILFGAAFWTPVLLPKRVSAFTNGSLKTNFCFGIALQVVAVRGH